MSVRLLAGFPQYLVEHGWDVHVVSSPGPNLTRLSTIPGVTVHSLPMMRNPSVLRDLQSLLAWLRLLRRIRPDILSVGTPKAGLLGTVAGRMAGVPQRVYMLRGLRLETVTGLRRKVLALFERLTIGNAHCVLAVSPSLRAQVISFGLCRPENILVLGHGSSNGVDLVKFDRRRFSDAEVETLCAELGIVRGIPTIGFVGRLTIDKGLDTLAAARAILLERGIDHQLLIVGAVDEGAEARVAVELRRSGRRPVEVGVVSAPERYYPLIDVLCLPTRREGFPNVVLEAAAASVPTVTTDATGAVDSVIDGQTGRIVPHDDPQALADALEGLIASGGSRTRSGAAARLRVEKQFSNEQVWSCQERLYQAMVRGGTANAKRYA